MKEKLEKDHTETFKMQVPGGWLVKAVYEGVGVALTFVPDPEHKWELK